MEPEIIVGACTAIQTNALMIAFTCVVVIGLYIAFGGEEYEQR
jgi:hypothetical protein|tara:strand:- start:859 stop:987 length:129 start_codon:yes stop_codon:yes gene_type:complete